jgi:hypothetical protein
MSPSQLRKRHAVRVDRIQPAVVRLTADAGEIAELISAARWVTQGCPGRLTGNAVNQLRRVLTNYDDAAAGAGHEPTSHPSHEEAPR